MYLDWCYFTLHNTVSWVQTLSSTWVCTCNKGKKTVWAKTKTSPGKEEKCSFTVFFTKKVSSWFLFIFPSLISTRQCNYKPINKVMLYYDCCMCFRNMSSILLGRDFSLLILSLEKETTLNCVWKSVLSYRRTKKTPCVEAAKAPFVKAQISFMLPSNKLLNFRFWNSSLLFSPFDWFSEYSVGDVCILPSSLISALIVEPSMFFFHLCGGFWTHWSLRDFWLLLLRKAGFFLVAHIWL